VKKPGLVSIIFAVVTQIIWICCVFVRIKYLNWIVFDAILLLVLASQIFGIVMGIRAVLLRINRVLGSIGCLLGLASMGNVLLMTLFLTNVIFNTGGPPPGF
jgi:hypothetical protein